MLHARLLRAFQQNGKHRLIGHAPEDDATGFENRQQQRAFDLAAQEQPLLIAARAPREA
jgi:hypothetical protein